MSSILSYYTIYYHTFPDKVDYILMKHKDRKTPSNYFHKKYKNVIIKCESNHID